MGAEGLTRILWHCQCSFSTNLTMAPPPITNHMFSCALGTKQNIFVSNATTVVPRNLDTEEKTRQAVTKTICKQWF